MAVTWDYDGAGNLQAHLSASTVGHTYVLGSGDNNGSGATLGGTGGAITLTQSDTGGLNSGDVFYVWVRDNTAKTYLGITAFKFGTADTVGAGFAASWTYDGDKAVSVDVTTSSADSYSLFVFDFKTAGQDSTSGFASGPGSPLTLSATLGASPVTGSLLIGIIQDQSTSNISTVATRIFTQGVSGSGAAGDPQTGGTQTGTAAAVDDSTVFGGPVRVGVAFNAAALDASPTWTYLTDTDNLVGSYQIDRGRQFEFDKTDAGTASVTINDKDGVLDPTNSDGPYYGLIEPLLQIRIELWDPVALQYQTRFRGWIEDYDYSVDFAYQNQAGDTKGITQLRISCVDIFEILTAIEMQPGAFGDALPSLPVDDPGFVQPGNVFFDNALAGSTSLANRIDQVMGNAGIDPAFYVSFTLNVWMQESVYSPSENVLQVIQDCADAEFPTVSNVYGDRFGRLAIHGRLAKFDPDGTAAGAAAGAWDFHRWQVGDGKAVAASPSDTAHVRSLSYNRGLSKVFNSAFCTPTGIDVSRKTTVTGADMDAMRVKDDASIATFGIRSWSAENLLIGAPSGDPLTAAGAGTLTGNDAITECVAYATYIVANYKTPRNRISSIGFKSMLPSDSRAAATWDFLCQCDISDVVEVTVRGPGDSPTAYIFNAEEFFIEGVHEEATPATGEYAYVTLTLDLSPKAYFPIGGGGGVGVS